MTPFKGNMTFAICLYLLGDTFIAGQAGQEMSENAIDAAMQWGVVLMGYCLVIASSGMAIVAFIRKMAENIK